MGLKDLGDLMKQAGEIQQKMLTAQEEIAKLEVTGESGAGLVKVAMTGRHEIRRVDIDDSLLGFDPREGSDKEVLEDLIAAACNDAARRVEEAQKEKMAGMAGGLGLPLGQMPF